jgi:alpha-mannosidase
MFLSIQKVQRRIDELARLRFIESRPIGPVQAEQLDSENRPLTSVTLRRGERWGSRDALYNLSFQVEIPESWRGQLLTLNLNPSTPPDGWVINTVEGLLFIDGKAFHAIDRYHREIILLPELAEKKQLNCVIRLWTGISEDFHTFDKFELRRLDEGADRLWLLMDQISDALRGLPEQSPTYIALLSALDEACLKLDFRQPHSAEFYTSCREALEVLTARLKVLAREAGTASAQWQPHVIATGHAHIDVAWLWRLRHTRYKAANTFSSALYHMDRYPHFVFTQSQPQLYEFVKEDQPELFERIKEKVKTGQWEPEGAMWVESDTNLTGGESLVRQFLFGQRFFEQEFGKKTRILWLPDVFGYSAALPQLIKKAGADYFITTKISWNDTNRVPVDTFKWQGLDGTEVLAYFITAQTDSDSTYTTYNGDVRPYVLARTWYMYQHKELNRELLLAYGYGDGGGGPTRPMIEAANLLAEPLSREIPTASTGRAADFMDRLAERVGNDPNLPHWVGELYLEYHRGTYTSQGRTKRGNRLAERDLHNAEWLATLARRLTGQSYPQEEINAAWKTVLTHQFHDILPGSSIGPVYADALENYAKVKATTDQVIEQAQQALAEKLNPPEGTLVAFNSLPWSRSDLLELQQQEAEALGLPLQKLENDRALVEVRDVPSLGYKAYTPGSRATKISSNPLIVNQQLLENEFYRIELNERGQITRLLDKQAYGGLGREVVRPGERANLFQLFEDKPKNYDAWNIDNFYEEKSWELDQPVSVEVIEQGPLRAGLRLEWLYLGRTRVIQKMFIYADSRRIDFVTEVDWQERQTLMKVAFPVEVHNGRATAEIQFGNIERPTHRNTSWDKARYETCAHKWIDLSEGDYGVALLNDCKYGYDIQGRTMRLTLLRGPISPDPDGDLGHHEFTYSLYPHSRGWFEGRVHRAAYELNYPLLSRVQSPESRVPGQKEGLPESFALVETDQPNIVVETVKQAEDSEALVLRVYECANQRGPFTLTLPFAAAQVSETNLLEEEGQSAELSSDGRVIKSFIQPYEVKTFLIQPRS